MKQENIPNYIGYALILITAAHLGCEVEMLDTAREVWRTKRTPDAPLLGMYRQAASRAIEAIGEKGLAGKADRLAEVYYITGEFPDGRPVRQYKDYLSMYVLYNSLGDCTAGGVSSRVHDFQVFAAQPTNPVGEGMQTLTQNRSQTIHKERDVSHAFHLCPETFDL